MAHAGTTTTIDQENTPPNEEKHEGVNKERLDSSCIESDDRGSVYSTQSAVLESISTTMNRKIVLDDATPRAQSWKPTTHSECGPSLTLQNSTLQTQGKLIAIYYP